MNLLRCQSLIARIVRKVSRWVMLTGFLLLLLPVLPAGAENYTDTFSSIPWGSGVTGSFTTGSAATGLSYSGSYNQLFAWEGTGKIDCDGLYDPVNSPAGSFTITSRDGKAFVFNRLDWDDDAGGATIKGDGPEPFTINVSGSSTGVRSPSGGSKLVTKVTISSSDMWSLMDNVNVELDVPGAAVYGNGTLIKNGDTSASTADDTDMGTTPVGTPVTQDFELRNLGDATLTVDSTVTVSGTGFSITQQPSSSIAVGGISTLTVQFNPSTAGVVTGTVTIDNNSAADDYTFRVEGEGDLDTTNPDVTINQAGGQADPTNGSPINFTVTFSEVVSGFATGDVTVGGSANPTTGTVTGSGTTYNVAVSGMTGNGTVTASIGAGVAEDGAGNTNNASTSTDNEVSYDGSKPDVTINQAGGQADPTNGSPINFTVIFSEVVSGFATGDVTVGGSANPTTGTVTGSGTTYNVAVSGMSGNGTVTASIGAGVAEDGAGNTNNASTSTDNEVSYDGGKPDVTINQAGGQVDPTNSSPINFTVEFTEEVTGFATGDVTVGGTANPTTGAVTGTGTTYNVAVSGMSGNGTVTASIEAGVAEDGAGNTNNASTSTDNTVDYNLFDYGDASDPLVSTAGRYPTLRANNGPRHIINNNLRIGSSVDGEPDGQPSVGADGDDTDGTDDEDGVAPGQLIIGQGQSPSIVVIVTNQTGAQATVSGWIDYDRDGIFELGEKATTAVNPGDTQATLDFPAVPMDASGKSFARFRISTNGGAVAGPTGEAPDGEVEDYEVEISNAPTISGTVTDGVNPFPNVTITFSHDSHTETTAGDGTYVSTVPYNTTTTITPSHASVSGWSPASRDYSNINADQSGQDFVADGNQDGDGVPLDEEKGPNGNDSSYDGNGDGIPDFIEDNVASLHTYDGNGYVTLAGPDSVSLENVQAVANPSPADAPANAGFPHQFFEFEITGLANGAATTLTLYLSNEVEINTYWKFGPTPDNPTPHWYAFLFDGETGAEIVGNTIILHFVDGKRGDDDLTANGVIVDQGGPAFLALAIPTLSQWGIMLLALLLCAVGIVFVRRSRSSPA